MNIFTAAHKLTKSFITEFGSDIAYKTFFSYSLKALHMQANQAKRYSFAESDMQILRMPEVFTKSSLEVWKEKKANKFFWNTQVSHIKKSFPSAIAKSQKVSEGAAKYYKEGQAITMC